MGVGWAMGWCLGGQIGVGMVFGSPDWWWFGV